MIPWTRDWTSVERTRQANARLGVTLAFVAGAANAGGFLAVGQYTSHMTGVVSSLADNIVLGNGVLVAAALGALIAFMAGAATTAWIVNWSLRRHLRSAYSLPLLLEALSLLVFGLFGAAISGFPYLMAPLTVLLLCFIMGLQNAVITKISHAEIRTTHVTGIVTDLGIEIGKMLYVNRARELSPVRADLNRLRLHLALVTGFFLGGLSGALGFKQLGYVTTVPLALLLLVLTLRPLFEDARAWARLRMDA